MAVKVWTSSTANDTFTKATRIIVEDGHLLVREPSGGSYVTVGAYPPGLWKRANSVEAETK